MPDPTVVFEEIMRHQMEHDPNGEGALPKRCICGGYTERAPHYAPWVRHIAEAIVARLAQEEAARG